MLSQYLLRFLVLNTCTAASINTSVSMTVQLSPPGLIMPRQYVMLKSLPRLTLLFGKPIQGNPNCAAN